MSGDTCNDSSDCCSGLTCQSGCCQPAPTCSKSGDSCKDSSDCCSGLECESGCCQPPNICKNPTEVSNSGTMEGNLPVHPGDVLQGGYDLTIPGNNQDTKVTVTEAKVVVAIECPDGSTETVRMDLPDDTFSIPAGDTGWFPSGDQKSPLVWQGSVTVPEDLCGGEAGHAPQGAEFTADLASSNDQPIHVRFHYASCTLGTSGSWSSTQSYEAKCP